MKKLIIPLLAILLVASCSEEQITPENESQLNPEKIAWLKAVDAYKADIEQNMAIMDKKARLLESTVELDFQRLLEAKEERALFRKNQFNNLSFVNKKSLIKVPEDYASLQEAVDNAEPNGQIQIIGNLENQGEVFVDVEGIKIKGADNSSISGTAIHFMAENIEVSNLDLQIKIMIGSDADGAKVIGNNIISPPIQSEILISMREVSGCLIKDNLIVDENNTLYVGIYGFNTSENKISSNTVKGGSNTLAHIYFFNSNNNEIKDCNIEKGGFWSGAGILFRGDNNDNIINGCNINNVGGKGIFFEGAYYPGGAGYPYLNRGKNNQILNCIVKNYSGGSFSRGISMWYVESSLIRNCEVNNKDAVDPDNVFSEGINMVHTTDSKIENCITKYNSGGGIAMSFNLRGTNSIINCKVNNNGGAIPGQLGCFGLVTIPQDVNGSILIDNCEVNNNIAIGEPTWYEFYNRSSLQVSYSYGPSNSFSYTISNCVVNNNSGTFAGGIGAADFPDYFGRNLNITFNIYNNVANGNKRGMGVSGTTNAVLTNNIAQNNSICDFSEAYGSNGATQGTILTNNNFETICDVTDF